MLDEYLLRDDVLKFIKNLKTNESYYQKIHSFSHYPFPVSSEIALYIFYDVLLKYKMIIDDDKLLDDYLNQVSRLYRKLDDFDQIRSAIHRLLAKMASVKYEIHDWRGEGRDKMISLIYDKYIEHGYLFHGFSDAYSELIQTNGFVPERYENYYDKFQQVNTIFQKYGKKQAILKDFENKNVYFCDDVLLGCFYSMYAPMYYFQFLTSSSLFGKRVRMREYLIDDYEAMIIPLKKYMSNNLFKEKDKSFILDLVKNEWNILQEGNKEVTLLCVPRKKVLSKDVSLQVFLDSKEELLEVIDRLLSSKYNNVSVGRIIPKDDIQILHFPHYYERKMDKVKEKDFEEKYERINYQLLDARGSVSILLILGSVMITLGIILTIINMVGG